MTYHSENLAALIGSRICHDLISPIGAVNNGLELLALSGAPDGPEMSLVADSAASANARIRQFRLAFGIASEGQMVRGDEITDIWAGVHPEGRYRLTWSAPVTVPRRDARLVILACLCLEAALPRGGALVAEQSETGWTVSGHGANLTIDTTLWSVLTDMQSREDIQPGQVQFILLPHHLHEMGRLCRYHHDDQSASILF